MNRLNVVHIISALPVGGVERNLLRVLPLLAERGVDARVITTREEGALAEPIRQTGIPVELIKLRTRYDPFSLRRLARHLRELHTHVVQTHMRRANTSGRLAAMLADVPVRIATERDMGTDKSWKHHLIDRWLARYSGAVVGVTPGVVEHNRQVTGIPAAKFRVVPTGIDLDRFRDLPPKHAARQTLGLPAEAKVVGFVGRLHPVKNLEAIIPAFAEPPLGDAVLAVIGDGRDEYRQKYQDLADSLGLHERVRFLGWRDDLDNLYGAMDAAVMASHNEGIANSQMEALAAGVPLASTRVGFAANFLEPERDFMLAEDDSPAALAGAMARALEPATAARLAQRGRELMQEFSIERQADRWAGMYHELIACSRSASGSVPTTTAP